jgi:hypothetical protein
VAGREGLRTLARNRASPTDDERSQYRGSRPSPCSEDFTMVYRAAT